MAGPKLYDANKQENQFRTVLPILDEMNDDVKTAVISIVKKNGETVTLKFGMATVTEAQQAIGALEVAKTSLVSEVLFATNRQD